MFKRVVWGLTIAATVAGASLAVDSGAGHAAAAGKAEAILATENCTNGIRRPKTIVFYCGDAGEMLTNLRWSRWGGIVAVGTGVWSVKLCDPDCATGGISKTNVTVRLYKRRSCPERSHRYYRRATIIPSAGKRAKRSIPCPF